MFSLDDRAGNVITTVAIFVIAATILYIARGAFLILLLSLLFAYLLEPAVTWVQQHSRLGRKNRTWAIAQVYLIGILVLGSVGYKLGPRRCGANKEPECGCARDLARSFQWKGSRWSGGQARLERRPATSGYRICWLVTVTSSPVLSSAVQPPSGISPRARFGFSPFPFWPPSSCETGGRWRRQ